MPNLKQWIEAQLKRGYTKQQIKEILNSKGYPQKAVALVDKTNIFTPPDTPIQKKVPSKLIAGVGLVVVFVLAVWFINTSFDVPIEPIQQEPQTVFEFARHCSAFTSLENEIPCEEAVNIALKKYPGEAMMLSKTKVYENTEQEANVWLIKIKLDELITIVNLTSDIISTGISRDNGEFKYYKLYGV